MFPKGKRASKVEQLLLNILDAHENEIIIVQDDDGSSIIANVPARKRLAEAGFSEQDALRGFEDAFPELRNLREPGKFNIKDANGRTFSLTYKKIQWIDETPAKLFIFNDTENEQETSQMLYNLAYLDFLTQVPNRLKLKEDFKVLEPEIAAGTKCGVVALFDLDNFKGVNDTYGHNMGDVMLQRLAEHFDNDPAFSGRLYRLGGDEFILLYAEEAGARPDMREYYIQLLGSAINSYTVPNIDVSCTISMGAAFFPAHGDSLSALLRKSDIALYKAKAAGRNRLEIFENEDDIVQGLKDLYINILPILDVYGGTFGYELTDGDGGSSKKKRTVSLVDFNRTLDILGLEDIYSDKRYFIEYTKHLLAAENNALKNKFIILVNIAERCVGSELAEYAKLKKLGFTIALTCYNVEYLSDELLKLASYVKVAPRHSAAAAVHDLITAYKDIVFIGDRINSPQNFAFAQKSGYTLFMGNYFKEVNPDARKIKSIEPLHVNYYRLLKLTCTGDFVDFNEICDIISSDLGLSYRLLRLINSVSMEIKTPISSISMALTYLGEERLKKWIALMSLRGINPGKPDELIRVSMMRAKFGENLAPYFDEPVSSEHVFMMGLLSLLHVALDRDQEQLLSEMSIDSDIRESLLSGTGKYSDLLAFFKDYEYSNWEKVSKFAKNHGLTNKIVNEAYISAAKWYNDLTREDDKRQ